MSRLFIGFFFLIFLASCQKKTLPDGVVEQKMMVPLLYDFHLAEGYISSLPVDSSRLMARNYYHAVFEKYGTDSTGFQRSLTYYANDPQVLNQIYTEVRQRLENLQKDEQAKLDAENRKIYVADSIKSAKTRDSLYRIMADSVRLKLSSALIYKSAYTDSTTIRPSSWSLPLYEALVGNMLLIKGKLKEVNQLLSPQKLEDKKDSVSNKEIETDSIVLRPPH